MHSLTTRLWATAVFAAMAASLAVAREPSSSAMSVAATSFVSSLTPEQRARATFAFDTTERRRWHFIPTESFARNGLTIKEMTGPQRTLAHDLLKTGLSQRGYLTATQIMDLERVLHAIESAQPRPGAFVRDPERYFVSIFGTPSNSETWAWRVEGHHMSLHFTIAGGRLVAGTPTFFGTNPAEVREGPSKGTRVLAREEDAARALLESLDASQSSAAIIDATAPGDIVTMNRLTIDPLAPGGILVSRLTAAQRALLVSLVDVYVGRLSDDVAAEARARIVKAGWDRVAFAWAGSTERGKKHYYRVQGPTFLIEYDNTQNDGNHIHSVWRDFNRDFGADLLRDHVRSTRH